MRACRSMISMSWIDNFARAKLIVHTTLLHARETAEVARDAAPVELELAER